MADCEAPSFSLGLDFLFDSQPQIPVQPTIPNPRSRNDDARETECEAPSFSLGIDFLLDPESQIPAKPISPKSRNDELQEADFGAPSFSLGIDSPLRSEPRIPAEPTNPRFRNDDAQEEDKEEEYLGSQVADSDPDSDPGAEPARILRRLRRGLPRPRETTPLNGRDVDDDIEDFSSEEDVAQGSRPSTQYHSVCSTSKISLNGCGAISRNSEPSSTVTASTSREKLFAKSTTVSPVRKFQLIDSDSDDPSTSEEDIITGCSKTNQSSVKQQRSESNASDTKSKTQTGDLWKYFTPIKSFHVPTPTLDEVCEEYFSSEKNKNALEKPRNDTFHKPPWNEAERSVPAHRYFFHRDQRIRDLVCERFSNFYPLSVGNDVINQLNCVSAIDYLGQFGNTDSSKRRATQQVDQSRNAKRGRKSTIKRGGGTNSMGESSRASQSWVDPRQAKATPTSRARKVSKKGQSTPGGAPGGHWFTGPNGQKVYVDKNGKELSGRMAYNQYKKDRGGYSKSKRKAGSKKKT